MTEVPESGNCYNCGNLMDSEFYCFGCQEFICDECDTDFGCFGSHEPDDHLIVDEDKEEW